MFTFTGRLSGLFKDDADDNVPVGGGVVRFEIRPKNNRPYADRGVLQTTEGQPAIGQLNAVDPDGDALTFIVVTPPSKGNVTLISAELGTYRYTPAAQQFGPDSFTFKVTDGEFESNVATVNISISNINDPPTVSDSEISIRHRDRSIRGQVLAFDPDGDALLPRVERQPTLGTVRFLSNGDYEYTAKPDIMEGVDTFTFSVSDGALRSGIGTVTIRMKPQLEGTWRVKQPILFDIREGGLGSPYTCAQADMVISHSRDRLFVPGFAVNCNRGSQTVQVFRPAVDLALPPPNNQVGPDGPFRNVPLIPSVGVPFPVIGSFDPVRGTFSMTLFDGPHNIRIFTDVNSSHSQEVYPTHSGGVQLIEAFDYYRYSAWIQRVTP